MPAHKVVTPEMEPLFRELYPVSTWVEIRDTIYDRFNVTISRRSIYRTGKVLGLEKNEGYMSEFMRRRATSERRRLVFGLEQRTNMRFVVDRKLADKKRRVKTDIVKRNGYISERCSDCIYYDGNTRRSAYIEQKYARMLKFMPVEGFDPADSVWVSTKQNKWKCTG